MFSKNKNFALSLFFIILSMLACNLPGNTPPTETPTSTPVIVDTATATFTAIPSETPSPTGTVCLPTVTSNTAANVRSGPGQVYNIIGALPQGGSAPVAGKSYDGTWWYIEFAGGDSGHAWVSNTVTSAICIPDTLALIVAPPTPILPSATPTLIPSSTPTQGLIIIIPPIFIIPSPTPTLKFILPPIIIKP